MDEDMQRPVVEYKGYKVREVTTTDNDNLVLFLNDTYANTIVLVIDSKGDIVEVKRGRR